MGLRAAFITLQGSKESERFISRREREKDGSGKRERWTGKQINKKRGNDKRGDKQNYNR